MDPAQQLADSAPKDDTTRAMLSGWDQLHGQEMDVLKKRNAEMGKATDAAISAGRDYTQQGQQALGKMQSQMQPQPKAPNSMAEQMQGSAWQWMGIAAALGALAGAFTRNHTTNALAAFSGVIQGFAKGNAQAVESNFEKWKAESQAAEKTNADAVEQYKLTMANAKLPLDQRMNEIQMVAAKWQDQLMYSAAAQKNFTMVAQIINQRERNAAQFGRFNAQISQFGDQYEQQKKEFLARYGWNDKVVDQAAQLYVKAGPKFAFANLGRLPQGVSAIIQGAVRQRAQELEPDTEKMTHNWQRYASQGRAETAFGTGRQGDVLRSQDAAIQHLGTLQQLGQALGTGDIRAQNAAFQAIGKQFGVAAPTNFDAAKQIIGQEVVKAVIAGGGGVTERRQAQDILDRVNTPDQLAGAIATIRQLLVGQRGALKRQYERSTGESDFDKRFAIPGMDQESQPQQNDNGGFSIRRMP